MQQIREEHKKLETKRDILTNILKKQNSCNIKLTEFENFILIYVDAIIQIITRNGLIYTKIGSLSYEINEQTKLFQFWSNSHLN